MNNTPFYTTLLKFHENLNAVSRAYSKNVLTDKARHPVYEIYMDLLEGQEFLENKKINVLIKGVGEGDPPRTIEMDALSYVILDQDERLIDFFLLNSTETGLTRYPSLLKKSEQCLTYEDVALKMIEKGYNPWLNLNKNGHPEILEYAVMRDSLRLFKACVMHPHAKDVDVEKFLLDTKFKGRTFWEIIKSAPITEDDSLEYNEIVRFHLRHTDVLPYKKQSAEFIKYLSDAPIGMLKVFYEEQTWPTSTSLFETYFKSINKAEGFGAWPSFFEKSLMFYAPPGSLTKENKEAWMLRMMLDVYPKLTGLKVDDKSSLNMEIKKSKVDGNIYKQNGVKWSSLSELFKFFIKHQLLSVNSKNYQPKHVLEILDNSVGGVDFGKALEQDLNEGTKVKDMMCAWFLCNQNMNDDKFIVEKVLQHFNLNAKDVEKLLVERFEQINAVFSSLGPIKDLYKNQNVLLNLTAQSEFLEKNTEEKRIEWLKSIGRFGFNKLSESMAGLVHEKLMTLDFQDKEKEAEFKVRALLYRGFMLKQREKLTDLEKQGEWFEKFWPKVNKNGEVETEIRQYIDHEVKQNKGSGNYFVGILHQTLLSKDVKQAAPSIKTPKMNSPQRF